MKGRDSSVLLTCSFVFGCLANERKEERKRKGNRRWSVKRKPQKEGELGTGGSGRAYESVYIEGVVGVEIRNFRFYGANF